LEQLLRGLNLFRSGIKGGKSMRDNVKKEQCFPRFFGVELKDVFVLLGTDILLFYEFLDRVAKLGVVNERFEYLGRGQSLNLRSYDG
jgi:hypothetical protein